MNQSDFTYDDLGMNRVTIIVANAAGNATSTEIDLEVIDNIAPVALGSDGTGTIDPGDIDHGSYGNCDLTFSLSKTIFDCGDLSSNKHFSERNKKWKKKPKNQVTPTVTDPSGNGSGATAIVKVVDNQGPVFS